MCGILGAVGTELDRRGTEEALRMLLHRGPDSQASLHDVPAVLGIARLAIIDVENGNQPVWNEDRSVAVVCNGEIYNYVELTNQLKRSGHLFRTRSDTEVLVHLYEECGSGLCEELRGMFAFAIWDKPKQLLLLARDRFGKKPLYYTKTGSGGLLFASEIKALRALAQGLGESWTIRDQSIYDYLSLSTIPQPHTVYDQALALGPGRLAEYSEGKLRISKYWQLRIDPVRREPYTEALEKTRSLIREAVRLRLRSDVPLGVFLSAGVDSSVVAYEAARQLGGGVRTFTVSVPDSALDESAAARRTAQALGVQNELLPLGLAPTDLLFDVVRLYDQPFADSSAIPSLAVSRLAKQHVTVVLNGDGGDELFGGYRRYIAARWADRLPWFPPSAARAISRKLADGSGRRTARGFISRFLRGLHGTPAQRYLAWTADMLLESDKQSHWRGGAVRPTEEWLDQVLSTGKSTQLVIQSRGDIQVNLLSGLLVKMDMANMAASLEGRSPLLDHKLAEYVLSVPDSYRVGWRTPKRLLRDAYRGRLPDEVIDAPKRGFEVPVARWLQEDWSDLLFDTVGSPNARVRSYLASELVMDIIQRRTLHDKNWAHLAYSLLVLELWLREQPGASRTA